MNKLFYVRLYSHSMNVQQRFLWTAENREELDEMVKDYTGQSSYRVEIVRFICDTSNYVAEEI